VPLDETVLLMEFFFLIEMEEGSITA